MYFVGKLLYHAIEIYTLLIIATVVVSWLIAFGVLNLSNPQAAKLVKLLHRATDPVMEPARRYIPSFGGIDFSPIAVLIGLMFLQRLVVSLFMAPSFVIPM